MAPIPLAASGFRSERSLLAHLAKKRILRRLDRTWTSAANDEKKTSASRSSASR